MGLRLSEASTGRYPTPHEDLPVRREGPVGGEVWKRRASPSLLDSTPWISGFLPGWDPLSLRGPVPRPHCPYSRPTRKRRGFPEEFGGGVGQGLGRRTVVGPVRLVVSVGRSSPEHGRRPPRPRRLHFPPSGGVDGRCRSGNSPFRVSSPDPRPVESPLPEPPVLSDTRTSLSPLFVLTQSQGPRRMFLVRPSHSPYLPRPP